MYGAATKRSSWSKLGERSLLSKTQHLRFRSAAHSSHSWLRRLIQCACPSLPKSNSFAQDDVSFLHPSFPHETVCLLGSQVPGCCVGNPCKKQKDSSSMHPCLAPLSTWLSQWSSHRLSTVSSKNLLKELISLLQNINAIFWILDFFCKVKGLSNTAPLLLIGPNCQVSPEVATFKPPKGRITFLSLSAQVPRFLMWVLVFSFISASTSRLAVLISSMNMNLRAW